MNEIFKCIMVILISVFCSTHISNTLFEKKNENTVLTDLNLTSKKSINLTNYIILTNWVTVTNFVSVCGPLTDPEISPGIPIIPNTNSVVSFEISPPTEAAMRLRNIARELIDLLENIRTIK